MNPVQLAQLLGHSGLRMIEQVYAHLNAVDGYDAVMRMRTASGDCVAGHGAWGALELVRDA